MLHLKNYIWEGCAIKNTGKPKTACYCVQESLFLEILADGMSIVYLKSYFLSSEIFDYILMRFASTSHYVFIWSNCLEKKKSTSNIPCVNNLCAVVFLNGHRKFWKQMVHWFFQTLFSFQCSIWPSVSLASAEILPN